MKPKKTILGIVWLYVISRIAANRSHGPVDRARVRVRRKGGKNPDEVLSRIVCLKPNFNEKLPSDCNDVIFIADSFSGFLRLLSSDNGQPFVIVGVEEFYQSRGVRFKEDFTVVSINRQDLKSCNLPSNLDDETMQRLADKLSDYLEIDFGATLREAAEAVDII